MRSHNPEIDPTDELPTVGPICREVEALLAWHGNGSLSSSEGRIVDEGPLAALLERAGSPNLTDAFLRRIGRGQTPRPAA